MVKINRLTSIEKYKIRNLSVASDQVKYVDTIESILNKNDPGLHPHVVTVAEKVIGFFYIDTAYAQHYEFANENELGLRLFFIDIAFQAQGYGKATILTLKPYLNINYKGYHSLVLTVNCQNQKACKAYRNNGFVDNGLIYHDGPAGPQHIMRMALGE